MIKRYPDSAQLRQNAFPESAKKDFLVSGQHLACLIAYSCFTI